MTKPSHTPGPLHSKDWQVSGPDGLVIAELTALAHPGDARLFAAAPDMHLVLENILIYADVDSLPAGLGKDIRAALAKARPNQTKR